MNIDRTVLIYISKGDEVLFLKRNKKKNDLNESKYIGVGGHIEPGETKEEALVREVKEETNLTLLNYTYRGELLFINNDYQEVMYLYTSSEYTGELKECDEGELHFINKSKIMDLNLWEGDRTFLPKLFNSDAFIRMLLVYNEKKLVKIIDESEASI